MPGGSWNCCLWTVLSRGVKPFWKIKHSFQSWCHIADKLSKCLKSKILGRCHKNYHPLRSCRLLTTAHSVFPSVCCIIHRCGPAISFLKENFFLVPIQLFSVLFWGTLYRFIHSPVIFCMNYNALETPVNFSWLFKGRGYKGDPL